MKRSVLSRKRVPVATLDPFRVVRRPHISEKSHSLIEDRNTYVFQVDSEATKTDIRNAVQKIWNVKVLDVRTISVMGKERRQGKMVGRSQDWKKAIVKLADGSGIDVLR